MRTTFQLILTGLLVGLATAGVVHLASHAAIAADHKEAPGVRLDEAADIADVYAFIDSNTPSNVVLVMTVNPFIPPPENVASAFDPTVKYVFHVDNVGDSGDHLDFTVAFGAVTNNQQAITVNGVQAGLTTPPSEAAVPPAPVINTFTLNGASCQIFAGEREDPFFFDFVGYARLLSSGTGFPRPAPAPNTFAGFNVDAICLEVPITALGGAAGNTKFGVWATTGR